MSQVLLGSISGMASYNAEIWICLLMGVHKFHVVHIWWLQIYQKCHSESYGKTLTKGLRKGRKVRICAQENRSWSRLRTTKESWNFWEIS